MEVEGKLMDREEDRENYIEGERESGDGRRDG